jgi:very-short-patch-repair endonuclease
MSLESEAITPSHSSSSAPSRDEQQSRSDLSQSFNVPLLGERLVEIDPTASIADRIALIAANQHARVSRKQLLAAGILPAAVQRRVAGGRLIGVHRGVYALPHTADVPLAAEAGALLGCGAGSALSHHTASTLWRLRPGLARPVHVTIPALRGGPSLAGVEIHRSKTLARADVRLHDDLPITSPARTLLDVSAALTDRDIERMLDEALFVQRIVTAAHIRDVLKRAGGHPGRARLARVAGEHKHSTRTESDPEEKLYTLIYVSDLPLPETQVPILGHPTDFFWRDLLLAVEVDAYGTHGSRARFESDRRRDARLLAEMGILVIRFTEQAIQTRPFEVIALLARTIGWRERR